MGAARRRDSAQPVTQHFTMSGSAGTSRPLLEQMARAGIEIKVVDVLELGDFPQGRGGERQFAVKGMQDDAFEQIAEGHVFVLGKRLQHLQQAAFDAHAGLNADYFQAFGSMAHEFSRWFGTIVPKYHGNGETRADARPRRSPAPRRSTD